MTATFRARYHGRCANCDEHISPGDEVVYLEDEVVHADCDEHVAAERPATVCPACRLTMPCDCEVSA